MNSLDSREQKRVTEFFNSLEPLRQMFTKPPLPSAVPFYDAIKESLAEFGTCEILSRQAERWNAAGIRKDSAQEHRQRSMRHQELGLKSLAKCRALVDDLEREFETQYSTAQVPANAEEIVKRIREDILSEVCNLEIKPHDVNKIMKAVDQGLKGAHKGSRKDVLAVCRDGIAQLERVRNMPDRGTSDNQPWWKVLGIILIVGAVASVIIACLYWPPCGATATVSGVVWGVSAGASVVAAVGGLLAAFC